MLPIEKKEISSSNDNQDYQSDFEYGIPDVKKNEIFLGESKIFEQSTLKG